MKNTLRSKRGVTLVELLAVIVILGIIAAIAVPAIGGLIERQRENAAEESHQLVLNQAKTYVLGEDLALGAEFTVADLVADDYLEASPYENVSSTITFVVIAGGNVEFKESVAAVDLVIDGVTVHTIPAA
jgi:type IV pilus assembly protein PilA